MRRSSRGMAWILGLSLGLAGSGLAEEWPVLSVTAPTAVPAETQAPAPETETADEAPHPAGTPETAEAETEAPGPEVPERTVLFWNTPVSSRDTEATFEGKEFVHLTELDQLLTEMPNLKKVNLWDKRTYLKEILPLFEAHPEVEIGMTITLNPSHVLRTDMTAYSTLGRQPQIAKMHTWFFGCLKGLKALDIGHMNVHSLDFLSATAPLKILIVADNGLKNKDIQALRTQTELEYLEIFKNYITDLTPLSGMTELRDLNIGYNDIRDLSPLDGLQKLERLWTMGNWWLPEEEIARFQALHPNCEVVTWSYGATGNRCTRDMTQIPGTSWRHHRHYDTIHWIFDHSEYIDWDVEVPQVKGAEDP